MISRKIVRCSGRACLSALICFTTIGSASGQTGSSGRARVLEEVIVTAQHREQSVQDVSMSITAFSGESLEMKQIEGAEDIQFNLPNVTIAREATVIRGIANDGAGYHVNGVYLASPELGATEYFDIARIEVLRGPQGTLYGRNTTAGVVNIVTQRPEEEWGGYFSATLGSYDTRKFHGAINIPITDNIRQRFAAVSLEREGYNENVFYGNQVDGRDSYEVRSSTSWDFTEDFSADLIINHLKEDSSRALRTKGVCTKDFENGCSPTSLGFETPDVTQSIFQILNIALFQGKLFQIGDYFANTVNPADYRTVTIDMEPETLADQIGVALEFNYTLDKYQLTSISGYYRTRIDRLFDFDRFTTNVLLNDPITGLPAPLTYRADGRNYETTRQIKSGRRDVLDTEQYSQEFRIASNYEGSLNFLLGAYYFENETYQEVYITHPALSASQDFLRMPDEFEAFYFERLPGKEKSTALFGELYWDITDNLRLITGLRYTDDEVSSRSRLLFLVLTDPRWTTAEGSWVDTTGKMTAEYVINDDHMVFLTASKGYRPGGINAGSVDASEGEDGLLDVLTSVNVARITGFVDSITGAGGEGAPEQYDAEYINAIEIGNKSTFLDGRLVMNGTAFYYDYDGLHLTVVTETVTATTNSSAEVYGAELEFTYAPTDQLLLELQYAYLRNEILEGASVDEGDPAGEDPNTSPARDENGNPRTTDAFGTGDVVKDLRGNPLPASPDSSIKLAVAYTFDLFDGYSLMARVDHFLQDTYFVSQFAKNTDEVEGWEQTDVQLVLFPNDGTWKARAYIKNIADSDDVTFLNQDGPLVGRFRTANVLEPRLYGVEFSYRF